MTPSFKSFEQLLAKVPTLTCYPNIGTYWAHLPQTGKVRAPETLIEHIDLVNLCALQLISLHDLDAVFDRLIEPIAQTQYLILKSEAVGTFLKQMIIGSIVFHDYGKVNENFQCFRMKNPAFTAVANGIEHHHSILSAYLFVNYYFERIEKLDYEQATKLILKAMTLEMADIILRHHSSTLFTSDFEPNRIKHLNRYLNYWIPGIPDHLMAIISKQNILATRRADNRGLGTTDFQWYCILKLAFSLLSASDYLATLCFHNSIDLPASSEKGWFGLLTSELKSKLMEAFKASTKYNKVALETPESLMQQPIRDLQAVSPHTMNTLRSRMLGEAVLQTRNRYSDRLFYLKAPTGSGKTNVSLAIALELLNADERLNKLFYVFPFTTLATQTSKVIRDTLSIQDDLVMELHSRAEWASRNAAANDDGQYGEQWENHVENLFVHFPIVLLSHIRFFDILKSNGKEINYLLHRLSNSVVIIDELQSYNPRLWEHVNYFITRYANVLNMRFILMSATLPEIGKLIEGEDPFVNLVVNPEDYFLNPNFRQRVTFDNSLLSTLGQVDRTEYLSKLADFVAEKAECYTDTNKDQVKAVIEFITKKSASAFTLIANNHEILKNYKLLLLSGTSLEPRRREVVNWLKSGHWLRQHPKVLLMCTQVVEAGVDIDMDIGFKDTSLVDSDEQLAGRVNRHAKKSESVVYLYDLDKEGGVYRGDPRIRIQREELGFSGCSKIRVTKDFSLLYDHIINSAILNRSELIRYFEAYRQHIRHLRFREVHHEFMLIDHKTIGLFIPISLDSKYFSKSEILLLNSMGVLTANGQVSGTDVFIAYEDKIIHNADSNFIKKRDSFKRFQSIMSKFSISVTDHHAKRITEIEMFNGTEDPNKYGYLYCTSYNDYYDWENGLQLSVESTYDFL